MEYDNILHKLSTNKEIKIRHSLEYQIIEQTMKTLVQFKKKKKSASSEVMSLLKSN